MKWLRSIGSVGVGVVVAWFLGGQGVGALWRAYECDYGLTMDGMCSRPPSALVGLLRLAVGLLDGELPITDAWINWLNLAYYIILLAAVAMGGLVTSLLAPAWRVPHAMLVGPLLMQFLAVPRPLVWSLPAMAGGVFGWMIVEIWALRRRSGEHAPVDGSVEQVG